MPFILLTTTNSHSFQHHHFLLALPLYFFLPNVLTHFITTDLLKSNLVQCLYYTQICVEMRSTISVLTGFHFHKSTHQSPNMLPDWNRSKGSNQDGKQYNWVLVRNRREQGHTYAAAFSTWNTTLSWRVPLGRPSYQAFSNLVPSPLQRLTWPLTWGLSQQSISLFNIYHDSLVGEDHAYPSHPQLQHGRKGREGEKEEGRKAGEGEEQRREKENEEKSKNVNSEEEELLKLIALLRHLKNCHVKKKKKPHSTWLRKEFTNDKKIQRGSFWLTL